MIHRYLPYTLRLQAPAVLSSLAGDRNTTRTLPFIPGSALRGAIARGFGGMAGDEEREREFRKLVLDGTVSFLNAYPVDGARRTLPTPVSLRAVKDQPSAWDGGVIVRDLAAYDDEGWSSEALVSAPGPFTSLLSAQPRYVAARRQGRVHQQRDRSRGRAWKEETNGEEERHGAIFAFEFLDANQDFAGIIHIRGKDEEDCAAIAEQLKHRLKDPLLLGRSRRGGYGGDATIQQWGDLRQRELVGQGLIDGVVAAGDTFRALLVSPCLIRDPTTGQRDPAAFLGQLREKLLGRVEVLRHRWSFEVAGGFNRKWRLELPQGLAISAGSTVVLKATEAIASSDLRAIEHDGFGERRTEGFGRIAFLEAPSKVLTLRPAPEQPAAALTSEAVPDVVRLAQRRILDSELIQRIEVEAARIAATADRPPSSSLLGRLRNALRADPSTASTTLGTWLDDRSKHALKRPAMDQLHRCRITVNGEQRSLYDWLRDSATGGWDAFDALLRLDSLVQRYSVVSQESALEDIDEKAVAYRIRLIDALLAALSRRNRGGASS